MDSESLHEESYLHKLSIFSGTRETSSAKDSFPDLSFVLVSLCLCSSLTVKVEFTNSASISVVVFNYSFCPLVHIQLQVMQDYGISDTARSCSVKDRTLDLYLEETHLCISVKTNLKPLKKLLFFFFFKPIRTWISEYQNTFP